MTANSSALDLICGDLPHLDRGYVDYTLRNAEAYLGGLSAQDAAQIAKTIEDHIESLRSMRGIPHPHDAVCDKILISKFYRSARYPSLGLMSPDYRVELTVKWQGSRRRTRVLAKKLACFITTPLPK